VALPANLGSLTLAQLCGLMTSMTYDEMLATVSVLQRQFAKLGIPPGLVAKFLPQAIFPNATAGLLAPQRGISNPAVNTGAVIVTPNAPTGLRWVTDYATFGLNCVVAQTTVVATVTDSTDGIVWLCSLAGAAGTAPSVTLPAGLHSSLGGTLSYAITAPAGGNNVTVAYEAHQVTS